MFRRAAQQLREGWVATRAWAYENALLFLIVMVPMVIFVAIMAVTIWSGNVGFKGKTFWDWMDLLIVPAVLAVGAYYFSRSQKQAELAAARSQKQLEVDLALDRQRQDMLQDYFDKMSELLLQVNLVPRDYVTIPEPSTEEKRKSEVAVSIAAARTLMVLRRLDSDRVSAVFSFLSDTTVGGRQLKNLIALSSGELRGVDWQGADLAEANLRFARLHEANLQRAFLYGADLEKAHLTYANLQHAKLPSADLRGAYLFRANLQHAFMRRCKLDRADLKGGNLQEADLTGAAITSEQLLTAASVEGAIMPDGVKLRAAGNPDGPTLQAWIRHYEASHAPQQQNDAPEA